MPFLAHFMAHFAHPHWPNFAVFDHVAPVILIHLCFALAAFVVGAIQIFGPKGTIPHRILGWIWVIFMFVAAVSSFFIRQINHGQFWYIHILSVVTVVSVPLAVYAARKHDVKAHGRHMIRLYVLALVVAGVLTFLPGRLMWQLFFA